MDRPCPTHLIPDEPSSEDAFEGTHTRIADAITELIANERDAGGRAIGLEGAWGSGKSTVLNLLNSRLDSDARWLSVTFDAWVHQGDPLRRAFLGDLCRALVNRNWALSAANDVLRRLAGRERTSKRRVTPILTKFGRQAAVAGAFVPIGLLLLNQAISTGADPVLILLAAVPALAPLILWFVQSRRSESSLPFFNEVVEEEATTTIEEPELTSVEFYELFSTLMAEVAKEDPERRLLLALDNLDRVDADVARSVLGTLQVFLSPPTSTRPEWASRLWILIPYDPSGIQTVWTDDLSPTRERTGVFLEKLFSVRFATPPLVLSDWRGYLVDKLKRAMPEHSPHEIEEVVHVASIAFRKQSVNPRSINLLVNQIGSVHRQWDHAFPLAHVAYFVLQTTFEGRPPQVLAEDLASVRIDEKWWAALRRSTLLDDLASMIYNTTPNRARQVLLAEPIADALRSGDGERLSSMLSNTDGVWAIIETVGFNGWSGSELASAADVLSRFEDSGIPSSVVRSVTAAVDRETIWAPHSPKVASGAVALARLSGDGALGLTILESLSSSSSPESESLESQIRMIVQVATALKSEGLVAEKHLQIRLPGGKERYIEAAAAFGELARDSGLEDHLDEPAFLKNLVRSIRSEEKWPAGLVQATALWLRAGFDVSWGSLAQLAARSLEGSDAALETVGARAELLGLLMGRSTQVDESVQKLVQSGHLTHHIAREDLSDESVAQLSAIYLQVQPDLEAQPTATGRSSDGWQKLRQWVLSGQHTDLDDPFVAAAERGSSAAEIVLRVVEANGGAAEWAERLIASLGKGDRLNALSPADLLHHWQLLNRALDSQMVDDLIRQAPPDELRVALEDSGFNEGKGNIYTRLVGVRSGDSAVREWLMQSLLRLEREAWKTALASKSQLLDVARLLNAEVGFHLGSAFLDGVHDYATDIADGTSEPKLQAESFAELARVIEPERVLAMRRYLAHVLREHRGGTAPAFFDLFGDVLADEEVLHSPEMVYEAFVPLVQDRNEAGLRWLLGVLKNHPGLPKKFSADALQELRSRLLEQEDGSEGDVSDLIVALIDRLGRSSE